MKLFYINFDKFYINLILMLMNLAFATSWRWEQLSMRGVWRSHPISSPRWSSPGVLLAAKWWLIIPVNFVVLPMCFSSTISTWIYSRRWCCGRLAIHPWTIPHRLDWLRLVNTSNDEISTKCKPTNLSTKLWFQIWRWPHNFQSISSSVTNLQDKHSTVNCIKLYY